MQFQGDKEAWAGRESAGSKGVGKDLGVGRGEVEGARFRSSLHS